MSQHPQTADPYAGKPVGPACRVRVPRTLAVMLITAARPQFGAAPTASLHDPDPRCDPLRLSTSPVTLLMEPFGSCENKAVCVMLCAVATEGLKVISIETDDSPAASLV